MKRISIQNDNARALSDRMDYLDCAKGISIILIVISHHLQGLPLTKTFLCSFRLTPFFLISGFLYAYKNEWERPFKSIVSKNFKRLLYPYITLSIVVLLWNALYYMVLFPGETPEFRIQEMLVYTLTTYGYNALWYLPLAFWATLLFLAIRKTNHHHLIFALTSVALMVFYILFDKRLTGIGLVSYFYCYIFRTLVSTVFVYMGYVLFYVFQHMDQKRENILLLSCVILSVASAALHVLLPDQFQIVNLAAHRLGNPYFFYLISTVPAIAIILICKKYLASSRLLTYFGKNSLIVMALHMDITVRIAWRLLHKMHINFGDVVNSLLVIVFELAMFPIIITVINKCFPFLLRFPSLNTKKS